MTLFVRAEAAGVVIGKQGWVLGRVRHWDIKTPVVLNDTVTVWRSVGDGDSDHSDVDIYHPKVTPGGLVTANVW